MKRFLSEMWTSTYRFMRYGAQQMCNVWLGFVMWFLATLCPLPVVTFVIVVAVTWWGWTTIEADHGLFNEQARMIPITGGSYAHSQTGVVYSS